MKFKKLDFTRQASTQLKHIAFAMVLGAGISHGQTIIDVGGAGVIGDTTLTTSGGIAKLPAGGDTWKTDGGVGNPVSSTLASPAMQVPAAGNVTLTFTHRYDFESGYDGGAVFVSVNGNPAVHLDDAAFSSNGYVGTTTTNESAAWAGGESVFFGQSAGYESSELLTSVANLGPLNPGDTVSIQFKGEWDDLNVNGPPAWEIGTVRLTDSAATDFLNVNFTADGPAGFTVANSEALPGPWTYNTPIHRFELDAVAKTADRYASDTTGSQIDIGGADISVVILTGDVAVNDTYSLFDLSGGTTLTGSFNSINLPDIGTWNTDNLETQGTITLLSSNIQDGTWNVQTGGDWSDAVNWLDEIVANGMGKTATIPMIAGGNRTINVDSPRTIGNIELTEPVNAILAIDGGNALTLAGTSPTITNNGLGGARRMELRVPIAGTDGLTTEGGYLLFINGATNYSGDTVFNAEFSSLGGIPLANIGGGSGRNISVAAGSIIQRNWQDLNNDFLNRLVATEDEIGVFLTATGQSNNNNDLDFSGSDGADLPNAFLGNWAGNGAQSRYNGVITPASDNYRIGYPGHNGTLHIMQPLVDIDDTPRGLLVGGGAVNLTADSTFTGDTVLRDGRLFLGRQLALQNSALNVGTVGGTLTGQFVFNNGSGGGAPPDQEVVDQPTLGGLIGDRNLAATYNSANQNNTNRLVIADVLGITLNVAADKTHSYGGNARLSPGMFLTKAGLGTQVLSGANDFTGPTAINEGTLAFDGGSMASPITVASGASIGFTLGSTTTSSSTVDLTGGTVKLIGTVNNVSSYQLMTASSFTGTPALDEAVTDYTLQLQSGGTELWLVYTGTGTPYGLWSGGASADEDTSGDGITNAVAWALGADGPNESALGLLPAIDNSTDPDYLLFSFNRSDAAEADPSTTISVQYGSNLTDWTTAVADGDNVIIEVTDGSPTDALVVKLKRSTLGAGGELFARLNVTIAP